MTEPGPIPRQRDALRRAAHANLEGAADSFAATLGFLGRVANGAEQDLQAQSAPAHGETIGPFRITSPTLLADQPMPRRHMAVAENYSPPLELHGTPAGTVSLAVTALGTPGKWGRPQVYWMAWNLVPRATIPEDTGQHWRAPMLGVTARQGRSWRRSYGYDGPLRDGRVTTVELRVDALDG